MKTIYLHIGTHKTGTTSLQLLLDGSGAALSQRGYLYPAVARPGIALTGQHWLAWSVRENKTLPRTADSYWGELRDEINSSDAGNIIISSEAFGNSDVDVIERVRHYLDGFRVHVIVYLRNEIDYMCSLFKQRLKGGGFQGSFRNFVQTYSTKCDYESLLNRWAGVFGADSLLVRNYDRIKRNPGLYDDFLCTVGLSPSDFKDGYPDPRNTTPSDELLSVLQLLNRIDSPQRTGRAGRKICTAIRRHIRAEHGIGKAAVAILGPWARKPLWSQDDIDLLRERISGFNGNLCGRWLDADDAAYFVGCSQESRLPAHNL